MIWIDVVILFMVTVSALLSLRRGLMQEAVSLAGWIGAYLVTLAYADSMAMTLQDKITTPMLRSALAFIVLFVASLMVVALVNQLMAMLVKATGFTATDRMLGMVFGALRGGLIVTALVMLAGFTSLPHEAWWAESMFIKHFQQAAWWLRGFLPAGLAEFIHY